MITDFAVGSNCCGIRLKLRSIFPLLLVLLLLGVDAAEAQTHSVLKSFGSISDGTGGRSRTPLVRGADGTLYGATSGEFGAAPSGALFKINADGSGYSALKWFTNSLPEGAAPDGLSPGTLALAGNIIYGTTSGGGLFGSGTVFKINVDGTGYTVLKQLSETLTGNGPSSLMLSGNTLFITTTAGGAQVGTGGTIFKVNTDGTGFSIIKSFAGSTITTPSGPSGKLLLLGNTLFGTTSFGGSAYYGTIFKLNTDAADLA